MDFSFKSILKKALKPFLSLLAKPGLGNPHTPFEAELLATGAKPVAIMSPHDITTQLQRAINDGHVITINSVQRHSKTRIYCHPDKVKESQNAVDILLGMYEQRHIAPSHPGLTALWEDASKLDYQEENVGIFIHAHDIETALFNNGSTASIEALLSGRCLALPPIFFHEKHAPNTDLQNAVDAGKIAAINMDIPVLRTVYAQANKQKEGEELFSRYYQGDKHNYPKVVREAGRIGELLGFSKNDIAYFYGDKYQNAFVKALMRKTTKLRKYARKEVMLMNSPRPSYME